MSSFVDAAPNVLICSSIFADHATQVGELINIADVHTMHLYLVLLFVVNPHGFCFLVLILRPTFFALSESRFSFCCASCCLCDSRLISSAKSRSSSCLVKDQRIPVLVFSVDIFNFQSTTSKKMVGDSKQPCLTPVRTSKGSVSFPLCMTWHVEWLYNCWIMETNFGGIP